MRSPQEAPRGQMDIMSAHPCFSDEAHARVGRIHLPIAPRCDIRCAFCERNFCAALEIRHPGWTAKLLSVTEAVDLIRSVMRSRQGATQFVVGVAGPGDPLSNDETFEALGRIHDEYPRLLKCVSTNGLLLDDKLQRIIDVGIRAMTVTVNAPNSQIGKGIYSLVRYRGTAYRGEEAARLLLDKQFNGIRKAADAGLKVKVNSVLIPGVNDSSMPELATWIKEAGGVMMNIMPLIPSGQMRDLPSPTCDELRRARSECEKIIPQFHLCQQCRADIIYLP